jgi:hypothetical protein
MSRTDAGSTPAPGNAGAHVMTARDMTFIGNQKPGWKSNVLDGSYRAVTQVTKMIHASETTSVGDGLQAVPCRAGLKQVAKPRCALLLDDTAGFFEQPAQHRAVTMLFVFTVTADGKVAVSGEGGDERNQMRRRRRAHFCAEPPREPLPALARDRPGQNPLAQRLARREFRNPHVKVIEPRVILLPDASGRAPDGADPHPFTGAWAAELDDANRHDRSET